MFSHQNLFIKNFSDSSQAYSTSGATFLEKDKALFNHWIGTKLINKKNILKNTIPNNENTYSAILENQIIQFSNQDKLSFSIFFPDGAKARVVVRDWPDSVEISIRTSSIRLNQTLKRIQSQAERNLRSYFSKTTFLLVHDDY